ncbi:MAG: M3 family oligoendopeptidase [Firmicutes bacterium]|nr:M3 family oligoendopeptidase [Bacillota bacterium]
MTELRQTWDLDSIFPGGSSSPELMEHIEQVRVKIAEFKTQVESLTPDLEVSQFKELIQSIQDVSTHLGQCSSFVGCLTAQDVHDSKARLLQGDLGQISASLAGVMTLVDQILVNIPDEKWHDFFADEELAELDFPLSERRMQAKSKMDARLEALVTDLEVDGYHAWSHLYNTIVGQMSIEVERDGKVQKLSMGQASNLLSDPDPKFRKTVFDQFEKAWAKEAELFASTLNHLAGFRVNVYKNRGWDDVLQEPLQINRMQRDTLEAMWAAVENGKPHLVKYLKRKAELLDLDQVAWYDLGAPVGNAGKKIPYAEAASFVVDQMRKFSPEIADFTQMAFDKNWVEAEDRGGKRPGAFCTSLPQSKESRVFMTYSGSIKGLGTLAHELGHAYHGYVLKDAPLLLRRYAMNVAETASTFGELLVVDGAIQAATDPDEKLGILEDKIGRSVSFFMDIHARFLFETRFYAARKKGLVSSAQLNELMVQAQQDAFLGCLKEYHPHFWASKLHFYITRTPFYNFPYTFGYLFSAGVYARAKAEGPTFAKNYRDLLADTARMTVEDLALKHLGVDLTKPDFWEAAVQPSINDVEEFLQLTDK